MSNIFVTGGTGFLSQHLIPKLQTLGHEVVTDWRYWNDRYETIIHLASVTHTKDIFDPKLIEANFILTNEVFKRPERILYATSCSARHNTNPYASSKLWSEYLGQKHGKSLGLRFFNLYGPQNNKGIVKFLMDAKDGQRIVIRGPELVRDYLFISDAVDEIIANLPSYINKNRRVQKLMVSVPMYNVGVIDVGSGIPTETMDLVNLYQKLSGKSFIIDVEEAGPNEPKEMVAEYAVPNFITLEEGLTKLISNVY